MHCADGSKPGFRQSSFTPRSTAQSNLLPIPGWTTVDCNLASEAVKSGIQGIPVNTEVEAKALLFPGSPTVRVNGEDVEPQQTSVPCLACRLYENRSGIPSEELLRVAISDAKRRE